MTWLFGCLFAGPICGLADIAEGWKDEEEYVASKVVWVDGAS